MAKIAINGFGRIGRAAFKNIIQNHSGLDLVAINDLADIDNLAYLLNYDSAYGIYNQKVEVKGRSFLVGDKKIQVFSESDPKKLPWKKLGVDIVLECTGRFTKEEDAKQHLKAGAKKVIISANSKTETLPHFILGVNHGEYENQNIMAMCSCTTNCASPIMMVLNENFHVMKAQMTTVHGVTSTQRLVDGTSKSWRKGRSAMVNIVPTTTGAAKAVTRILPKLRGRVSGSAFRVPVITGSVLEIVAQVKRETSAEEINRVFKVEADSRLKGILSVSKENLVSSDIVGNSHSCIIDLPLTEVLDLPGIEDENLVKVVAWYDNEWSYGCRLAEFAEYVSNSL